MKGESYFHPFGTITAGMKEFTFYQMWLKSFHQGDNFALQDFSPYTRATARDHGWTWRIPLQRRTGNGYVYASKFCSDDEAVNTLLGAIEGKTLIEPRIIPFKTGVRSEVWKKNCLAIGLASGFIEPLESTAIHLVVRGIVHFMRNFPDQDCDPALARNYNRCITTEYEEIRDFIVLHYCLTEREDTPFWRWCKSMELPPSLHETIEYFKSQGGLPEMVDSLFHPINWRSVCEGMGLRPKKYSAVIDEMDYKNVRARILDYSAIMEDFVKKLPTHDQFIRDNCSAY